MEGNPGNRGRISRAVSRLAGARWFFSFSSGLCATIAGILLTFGIESCRERQRVKAEIRKSMLQAVDNLAERFQDAGQWVEIIGKQDAVYSVADSLYVAGIQLSDSLCEEFRYTIPYVRLASFDHEFEKIFRGSYQLWQLQNRGDSLALNIGECYDGLNLVETTCAELTEGMLEQLASINATEGFYRLPPREWTLKLLADPRFQYFMSVRRVKSEVAADILEQARRIYDTAVLPATTDSDK